MGFLRVIAQNPSLLKINYDIITLIEPVKQPKNSNRRYLNDIQRNFIHEMKTKGYDVIGS